jgi:hypothetical protein
MLSLTIIAALVDLRLFGAVTYDITIRAASWRTGFCIMRPANLIEMNDNKLFKRLLDTHYFGQAFCFFAIPWNIL